MDTNRFIDAEKGIVYTTVTGELTLKEIAADMAKLVAQPSYRPEMPGLVDLRGVTKLLSAEDTAQLAQTIKSSPRVVNRARRALLVGSDLAYGMYRMLEAMTEDGTVEYRVFRDEGEARSWVEEAAAAARK
jgi:hypothetical protein